MNIETPSSPAKCSRAPIVEPGRALGFVAVSRFSVANGMIAEVKDAFRNRPHLVDGASGYHRMEVISPVDHPTEI
jgi:hypothetical protein